MEAWASIEGFPPYEINSRGAVRNGNTGKLLGTYDNGHGILQVVLRRDNRNHARAVHRLVAESFLDPAPDGHVPMLRDGNWNNISPENLEWKPRWFATKWTRQSKQTEPKDRRPILVVRTGKVYDNALECAKDIGGLEDLVLMTAQSLYDATYMGTTMKFADANTMEPR